MLARAGHFASKEWASQNRRTGWPQPSPTESAVISKSREPSPLSPISWCSDEPSSGLNDSETADLAKLLLSLLSEGLSILLIEHDMNLVDMVSDHVIVMQSGRKIAEGAMCDIRRDPCVIEAYLGSEED